jgi:hypothetical protein
VNLAKQSSCALVEDIGAEEMKERYIKPVDLGLDVFEDEEDTKLYG